MEPRFHRDARDDRDDDAARGTGHNGHTAAHADSAPAPADPDFESAIIELLLRGCTPADCAAELFGGSMLELMRTIGRSPRCQQLMREAMTGQQLTRSMRLEAIKGAVTERIYDIAIGHEYAPTSGPMSSDTVRAVEAQRRACVTLLRLDERGSPGRQEPVFPGDDPSPPRGGGESQRDRDNADLAPWSACRESDQGRRESAGDARSPRRSVHDTQPHGLHSASHVRLRADHATREGMKERVPWSAGREIDQRPRGNAGDARSLRPSARDTQSHGLHSASQVRLRADHATSPVDAHGHDTRAWAPQPRGPCRARRRAA